LAVETDFEFDSSLGSSNSAIYLTPSVNPNLNDTKSSTSDATSPTSTDDHDWFDYFDSDDDHALISTPVSSSDNKRTDSCNALLSLSDAVCGTLEPPPVIYPCATCDAQCESESDLATWQHTCVVGMPTVCKQCLLKLVKKYEPGTELFCPMANCGKVLSDDEMKRNLSVDQYSAFMSRKYKRVTCAALGCDLWTETTQQVGQFRCDKGHTTCISCLDSHNYVTCIKTPKWRQRSEEAKKVFFEIKSQLSNAASSSQCQDEDDKVLRCLTLKCGGVCFITQKEFGMFSCSFCKQYNCFKCNSQHYPFDCIDAGQLATLRKGVWVKEIAERISPTLDIQSEVECLLFNYSELSDEVERVSGRGDFLDATILQREMVRQKITNLTGADPALFVWHVRSPEILSDYSGVDTSQKLVTTKIDVNGTNNSGEMDLHIRETYLRFFDALVNQEIPSNTVPGVLNGNTGPIQIVAAYYHNNHEQTEKFEREKARLAELYPSPADREKSEITYLYHGTSFHNIESIFENNFSLDKCRQYAFGKGIYFTTQPQTAIAYSIARCHSKLIKEIFSKFKYVVVCKVLKGLTKTRCPGIQNACSYPTECVCDTHEIPHQQFVVVKEPDRILPVYELIIKINGCMQQQDTKSRLGGGPTVGHNAATAAQTNVSAIQTSSLTHAVSRATGLTMSLQPGRRQQADRAAAAAERRRQSAIVLQQTALHWPIHDPNVVRSIPYLPQPNVSGTTANITPSAMSSSGAVTRSSNSPSNSKKEKTD